MEPKPAGWGSYPPQSLRNVWYPVWRWLKTLSRPLKSCFSVGVFRSAWLLGKCGMDVGWEHFPSSSAARLRAAFTVTSTRTVLPATLDTFLRLSPPARTSRFVWGLFFVAWTLFERMDLVLYFQFEVINRRKQEPQVGGCYSTREV